MIANDQHGVRYSSKPWSVNAMIVVAASLLGGWGCSCDDGIAPAAGTSSSTSSEASYTEETSGSESSSTGTELPHGGRASLILHADLAISGHKELYRVDLVDGIVSEPTRINAPVATEVESYVLAPSQSFLLYETWERENGITQLHEWTFVPLFEGVAGPPSSVHRSPAPPDGLYSRPVVSQDESTLVYVEELPNGETDDVLYQAAITPKEIEAPIVAWEGRSTGERARDVTVSPSGAWIAITLWDGSGWLLHETPELSTRVRLGESGSLRIDGLIDFASGEQAAWFEAESGPSGVGLYVADMSGETPSEPLLVYAPSEGDTLVDVTASPDGQHLFFVDRRDEPSKIGPLPSTDDALFVVSFRGAALPEAREIPWSTGTDALIGGVSWRASGEWLSYSIQGTSGGAEGLYLVDTRGDEPSAPMLVAPPADVQQWYIDFAGFSQEGDWLYVTGTQSGSTRRAVYRVPMAGGRPGTPERLTGELEDVMRHTVSHDDRTMVYFVADYDRDVKTLHRLDLSGVLPGSSQRIAGPFPIGDENTVSMAFSWDDSAVLYGADVEFYALYALGLDPPGAPVLVADTLESRFDYAILDHVPP